MYVYVCICIHVHVHDVFIAASSIHDNGLTCRMDAKAEGAYGGIQAIRIDQVVCVMQKQMRHASHDIHRET